MTAVADTSPDTERASGGHPRRLDIQGLRAVAVALVLLFHAGVPWIPGGFIGVDVFFVISGYVVTRRLRDDVAAGRLVSLTAFLGRRARRLLPAAAVTIAATGMLGLACLPATRWASLAGDMIASGTFSMNVHLAARSVDYLAAGTALSPLQHFWSLGVEAQFYLVWGLLVAVGALLVARLPNGTRRLALVGALLVVTVLSSLVYGVWTGWHGDASYYFSPLVRFWEVGLGGLLAWRPYADPTHSAAAGRGAVRSATATISGALGIIAIALSAMMFTSETPFPGASALLPCLGAALVLRAGEREQSPVAWLLSRRPAVWLGDVSYSYYLWHWPLIVVATSLWAAPGRPLPTWAGVAVVLAAALPAWSSRRWVEQLPQPRRLDRRAWTASVVAAAVALTAGGASVVRAAVPSTAGLSAGTGAQVLGDDPAFATSGDPSDPVDGAVELAAAAVDDVADVYADGCHQDQVSDEAVSCTYGDPAGTITVALVGDSHAAQWEPALRTIAEERRWRLVTYTKSACPWARTDVWLAEASSPYPSCSRWVEHVTAELRELAPTAVVTSSGPYARDDNGRQDVEGGPDALTAGLASVWASIDEDTPVIAIGDTPYFGLAVPDCVAAHPDDLAACATDRRSARQRSAAESIEDAAGRLDGRVPVIDLTDYVCPRAKCAPVIGGVVVYRDEHHLTASYARSLADALLPALSRAEPALL